MRLQLVDNVISALIKVIFALSATNFTQKQSLFYV